MKDSTTADDDRVFVASESTFEEQDRHLVVVGNDEIAVVRTDDDYYALLNNCPHQNGPLGEGHISCSFRMREGGRGTSDLKIDCDRKTISCPWHGWPFDLSTGIHVTDPEYRIPTFDVVLNDGDVYVDL